MMTSMKNIFPLKYMSCSLAVLFKIGLTGFSSIHLHALAVCMHFHWCLLLMITLELTSSLTIKSIFNLECFSYFVSNLIIKYVQFQWTNKIRFAHPSQWKLLFLWVNESLFCHWHHAWKTFDSLEIMGKPNHVRVLFLAQRHHRGHSSVHSVCWKCKQGCICLPAKDILSIIWLILTTNEHLLWHAHSMLSSVFYFWCIWTDLLHCAFIYSGECIYHPNHFVISGSLITSSLT